MEIVDKKQPLYCPDCGSEITKKDVMVAPRGKSGQPRQRYVCTNEQCFEDRKARGLVTRRTVMEPAEEKTIEKISVLPEGLSCPECGSRSAWKSGTHFVSGKPRYTCTNPDCFEERKKRNLKTPARFSERFGTNRVGAPRRYYADRALTGLERQLAYLQRLKEKKAADTPAAP